MRVSVLVPAYNEAAHVERVLDAVLATPGEKEVIVVDDGSTDGTREILSRMRDRSGLRVIFHDHNQGKGAAVRTAINVADGEIFLLQDCDLEYDPSDYGALLAPILSGEAEVVYGRRTISGETAYSPVFAVANKLVSLATTLLFAVRVRDLMTAYKVMRADVARRLDLHARRYEIEAEITGSLLNLGYRIHEVPVSYQARSRAEGKKTKLSDGIFLVTMLIRMRIRRRSMRRAAAAQPRV